jgi:hypothetical protein
MSFRASLFTSAGVSLLFSLQASAIPMAVTVVTQGACDPLVVPSAVEELGSGFPVGEAIGTTAGVDTNNFVVCAGTDDSSGVDVVVGIENLTGIAFSSVWYVANPETSFTNADGTVNGGLALRIDHDGVNTPLLSASCFGCSTTDTILSPGEGWAFIIKNYSNTLGLSADAIMTPGVPDASGGPSSGSIIAIPVPEPTSTVLVSLGLLGLAGRRRNRH